MIRSTIAIIFFMLTTSTVSAQSWYYPMTNFPDRITVKNFGILINDTFYKGKESLFPFNYFYGYHAGVDLEVLPGEEEVSVPVYAVYDGTISYIGRQSGYGGVMLVKLADNQHTALYGHVKINNPPWRVGDSILAGTLLTQLGNGFSTETSRERKHLHFAVYKGIDHYFRGHEATREKLLSRWENPTEFLTKRSATEVLRKDDLQQQTINAQLPNPEKNIFDIMFSVVKKLLRSLGISL